VKRIKPDQPAYAVIAQTLRTRIKRKKLLPGTVLLESSLASIFGSGSRSPVKQALRQLQEEGIEHEYHLYPGNHDAGYFLAHLGEALMFHSRVFATGK